MTDDILEKAKDNRRQYEDCEWLLSVVTTSANDDIRIGCSHGSFSLASELKQSFVKMMTNYLNKEMAALNKEYEEL